MNLYTSIQFIFEIEILFFLRNLKIIRKLSQMFHLSVQFFHHNFYYFIIWSLPKEIKLINQERNLLHISCFHHSITISCSHLFDQTTFLFKIYSIITSVGNNKKVYSLPRVLNDRKNVV